MVQNTTRMLAASLLIGMDHVQSDLRLSDPVDLSQVADPVSFDEAIRYFKGRVSLTKAQWSALEPKLRFRAFTVARLSTVETIENVRKNLLSVLENGGSLSSFWDNQHLEEIAGIKANSPWYWETVFRTNIQTTYNAGRALQMQKSNPEYLEFMGINDERQTSTCASRSGTVLPATHPFWRSNWPPLHFNCRSTVRPVFKEEINAIKTANPVWERTPDRSLPVGDDLKGFGANPIDAGAWWRPVPSMANKAKSLGIDGEVRALAKEILPPEAYALVFNSKNGGFVELGMGHGKREQIGNLETAEILANLGNRVKLLNLDETAGVKTPDAFLLNGKRWEFKHPLKVSKTSIGNSVANASGQSTRIVIRPVDTGGTTIDELMPFLKQAVRDHSWVQEIMVILNGTIAQFTKEEILSWK